MNWSTSTMVEASQINKLNITKIGHEPYFVLKYKNEVTAEKASLDEVIDENNSGDGET